MLTLPKLVLFQDLIDGYNRFNLIRAARVVNCQSTFVASSFLASYQAVVG